MLIFEKIRITESLIFGRHMHLEPRKELQDLRGQNNCKNVGLVKHLAIYHYFRGLKLHYLFFISKIVIEEIS